NRCRISSTVDFMAEILKGCGAWISPSLPLCQLLSRDLQTGIEKYVVRSAGRRRQSYFTVDRLGRHLHLHVRVDTYMAERFAQRRIELGPGHPPAGAPHSQGKDALHRAFAVAAGPNDLRPVIISHGPGQNLGRTGAIAVD